MTKRWYIYFLAGFLLGLAAGVTAVHQQASAKLQTTRIALQLYKEASDALWDSQASRAYYSGNRPAAIYVLSEHLLTLQEQAVDKSSSQTSVAIGMVITHGRLAKLYAEAGEPELKSQHVAEAIDWSKKTRRTFTNEAELADYVATSEKLFGPKKQ